MYHRASFGRTADPGDFFCPDPGLDPGLYAFSNTFFIKKSFPEKNLAIHVFLCFHNTVLFSAKEVNSKSLKFASYPDPIKKFGSNRIRID
jgi:hypothetical protein